MPHKLARLAFVLPLAVTAVFTPLTIAQSASNPPPPLAGIAHAAIRVADLRASRAFYFKLGFQEAFTTEDKDAVTTQAFIKINDRQFIELYPRLQPSDPVGFLHVCFESADIAALNTFYRDRGLAPKPVRKAGAGNLLFTMEGPEHQNIEYTQYMPGSRHTNDISKHLDPNRISTALVAAALDMRSPQAAEAFYVDKLAFTPAPPLDATLKNSPSSTPNFWMQLPGFSAQSITFIPHGPGSAFHMFFAVDNLNQTAARLRALGIPFSKTKEITINDPDGNILVFVANPRFLLPHP